MGFCDGLRSAVRQDIAHLRPKRLNPGLAHGIAVILRELFQCPELGRHAHSSLSILVLRGRSRDIYELVSEHMVSIHVNSIDIIFILVICIAIDIIGLRAYAEGEWMPRQDKQRNGTDAGADIPIEIFDMPGHLIRRLHQASQAAFDAEIANAGFDLTPVQFAALYVAAARPGLDQASLASAIAFDRATTGGVIDRLEAKGLLRREIAKGDRRSRLLYAQPAGIEMIERALPAIRKAQEIILQGLSAQERMTFACLARKALAGAGAAGRLAAEGRETSKTVK
jgi:DNA-binding MarR family transcriptional regulator